MAATESAVGVATIEVFDGYRIEVTRRVKTIFGGASWRVINRSKDAVMVCVSNFRPASSLDQELGRRLLLPTGDCTHSLPSRHSGWIVAEFDGRPGDLYNYDVLVNGTPAADPELEI